MKVLLFPFSLIYGFFIWVRNFLFNYDILKVTEYDIPIISVGNISVGGTGKTPHIEYLIENLKSNNSIAVLSRGYKRKTKGFLEVDERMSVNQAGDEPLQVKRKYPEVTVAVCEKRVTGVDVLISDKVEKKFDVILLDDSFQHRYLKPGLSILLVDYNRQITKDKLLPYGRLREPAHQMKRADIILITKCPEKLSPIERRIMYKEFKTYPYQNLFFTTFAYKSPVNLESRKVLTIEEIRESNMDILLVTGIANPKPLEDYVNGLGLKVEHIKFPDHHNFTEKNLKLIKESYLKLADENKIVLTTEKDAIRLKSSLYADTDYSSA